MLRLFIFTLLPTLLSSAEIVVLENEHYSTGWDTEVKSTVWTRHTLKISDNKFPRRGLKYIEDKRVGAYKPKDFMKSGFERGHLVPAGDLNFSEQALQSTFMMTNIAPQKPEFNRGSWFNLEQQTRGWNEKTLKITTGALFDAEVKHVNTKVPIPTAFYKVIDCPEKGVIGFILPNKANHLPLENYVRPISTIEKIADTNFFNSERRKSSWFRKPMLFYLNVIIFAACYFYFTKRRTINKS